MRQKTEVNLKIIEQHDLELRQVEQVHSFLLHDDRRKRRFRREGLKEGEPN